MAFAPSGGYSKSLYRHMYLYVMWVYMVVYKSMANTKEVTFRNICLDTAFVYYFMSTKICFSRALQLKKNPLELSSLGSVSAMFRLHTAQGKQGILFLLFPDRENAGNFVTTVAEPGFPRGGCQPMGEWGGGHQPII